MSEPPVRQPKHYVTLGPVPEFIYSKKTPDGEHLYRHQFAEWAQPVLARDDQGKLHILQQSKLTVTERGIEDMAQRRIPRANPSHYDDNPRGLRRLRDNPFDGAMARRVAMSTGVVGGVGLVVGVGLNALMSRFGTTLNPYWRALIKAGAGVLGAIGFEAANLPTVAAGFGVGGVIAGGNEAYDYFMATRVAAAAPAPAPQQVPAPAPAPAQGMYPYYGQQLPYPSGQAYPYPYQQQGQYCYAPTGT